MDDSKRRFLAARKLLDDSADIEKFESVRELIKGLNPKVDRLLDNCSEAISKIEKLQKGEVLELSADSLPDRTDEEKKRKKAIILFISRWKELGAEVNRVRSELESIDEKGTDGTASSFAKIAAFAKGPFGIITILAILIAGALIYVDGQKQDPGHDQTPTITSIPSNKSKIKVISYQNKRIALSELRAGVGPECTTKGEEMSHYHALNSVDVQAIDGSRVTDPGGCGFGKVAEIQVMEIDAI